MSKQYPLAPDDPAWDRADNALSTLANMQVSTGTPEPLPPEPTRIQPTFFARALIQLAQLQTRLALLEQRSARQDAQIAELTRRLDESEGGK